MGQEPRIFKESTAFVVVDFQEALMKAMEPALKEKAVNNLRILCEAMSILNVPIVVTEQYPKGLGRTIPEVKEKIQQTPIEKIVFSCCQDEKFMSAIDALKKKATILTGVETHVCVLQTCLDLLAKGYAVHVVSNAVASRTADDWSIALRLMEKAGAWITTSEIILFQLLGRAGTEEFKKISRLVK